MLHDNRIRVLHDSPYFKDCFPTVNNIEGGVCYFGWVKDGIGFIDRKKPEKMLIGSTLTKSISLPYTVQEISPVK